MILTRSASLIKGPRLFMMEILHHPVNTILPRFSELWCINPLRIPVISRVGRIEGPHVAALDAPWAAAEGIAYSGSQIRREHVG